MSVKHSYDSNYSLVHKSIFMRVNTVHVPCPGAGNPTCNTFLPPLPLLLSLGPLSLFSCIDFHFHKLTLTCINTLPTPPLSPFFHRAPSFDPFFALTHSLSRQSEASTEKSTNARGRDYSSFKERTIRIED